MPTQPVRFGIIACSSIARRRALPAIRASQSARIEHIGSRSATKAREFAALFGVSKHGSYEDVIADSAVDAVYISTPPFEHEEWVRAAIARRKHVLCEKPAFPGFGIATELVRLARENDVRLMEGFMFRYHPQHAAVASLIRDGRVGEPRVFTSELTYARPPEDDFRLNPELGGGVFHDSAGYGAAAAQLMFSSPPVSTYCALTMDTAAGVDNSVTMTIQFANGETAQILTGFGLHYQCRYSVLGTKGRIAAERAYAVPADRAVSVTLETDATVEKIEFPPVDQFASMMDDFAIRLSEPSAMNRDYEGDLLRQHALMDAAWRSHTEQRAVRLAEVTA